MGPRAKGPRLKACLPVVCICSLLAAAAALAAPAIYLAPALGSPRELTVSGRVYREAPSPGSSTLSRNLRRLTASNWVGAPLTLSFAGQTAEVRTGHDGEFEVTFRLPTGQPGWGAGLHEVTARVPGADARAPVEVVADAAPFVVVSDFDDTLARTDVRDARGLFTAALLRDGDTHPLVEGMDAFFRCLRSGKPARPGFALVSGSPVQYGPRLMRFLARHGFPFTGLYLRNLGPGTLRGYKQPRIRQLLSELPQPVVLVGDSGEHDPEVYAEMREAFPGRVLQVYIRDVGRSEEAVRFSGMVLFREPREAAWHAARHGLASEACVQAAFPVAAGEGAP
jgi:phosphatidate phosphatase APP1